MTGEMQNFFYFFWSYDSIYFIPRDRDLMLRGLIESEEGGIQELSLVLSAALGLFSKVTHCNSHKSKPLRILRIASLSSTRLLTANL